MLDDSPPAIGARPFAWLSRKLCWLPPVTLGFLVFLFWFASPRVSPPLAAYGGQHLYSGRWIPAMFVLAVLTGVAVTLRHRWPSALLVLAVVGWLAFSSWSGLVVAVYTLAGTTRRRGALAGLLGAAGLVVFVPVAMGLLIADGHPMVVVLPAAALTGLLVGLPALAGLWAAARRQVLAGLRERAARLEREQLDRAERARIDERGRIAREMHDVLAHRVSLMVLRAGALEVSAADERTVAEASLIRTTGREALAELRQVLGILRTQPVVGGTVPVGPPDDLLAPQPTLRGLDRMLAEARAAGLAVHRHDEGTVRPLPSAPDRTGYRVIQEALTNVVKHAAGSRVDVVLRYLPDTLEIAVHNRATPAPVRPLPGSGLGLIGLRERVELLGGEFHARSRLDGGFTVLARLPAGTTGEAG
ncbi:sensor histidine kinase [Plantactinospora sp. CA-290183]|uniref:sensor histidine kinase n=1 Tax=Plantactinospora sp. CA-290183 TaxID=3240006 RepID=UPI003D939598